MSKRILLISLLVLGFILLASTAFAQALPSGYDEDEEVTTISTNETGAGTTFVQDLEEIRRRRIDDIIQKIRSGDPNVLRFIVYDVMEEVHTEVIRRARTTNSNFYAVLNMENAIPAYIGGFDNQDPKVRLRCIGWLGDWTDEIGTYLADIQKRTRDRLASRIETREEVKYGLRLLDAKIVRKIVLNKVYNGDETVLQNITAGEFIYLIHDELFLREVWCVPRNVKIRSIRLAPWWIDVLALNAIVAQRMLDIRRENERRFNDVYTFAADDFVVGGQKYYESDLMNRDREEAEKMVNPDNVLPILPTGYDVYRIKTQDDNPNDGREFELLKTFYYREGKDKTFFWGYLDHAGQWDIQSLYDIRYYNYSETGNVFPNEEKIVRALFGGLRSRYQVVRENCVRILIMLSDPYVILDIARRVIGVKGVIASLAKESKYFETAVNAWRDVQYSQYIDVARPIWQDRANLDTIYYYHLDGVVVDYNTVNPILLGVISNARNPWGYKWNYRIDIHELLRRMGYGQLFACEREEYIEEKKIVTTENTYFVESLFDLTDIDVMKDTGTLYNLIPDWHGVDEIDDEIFNPGPW